MPQGGRITISTRVENPGEQKPWIRVSIEDTGPGIPHGLVVRLFDPFFTTKEGGKGTGLGLAVSKRIVEEQGGRLICESPGNRTGAVFHILLPVARAHKADDNQ